MTFSTHTIYSERSCPTLPPLRVAGKKNAVEKMAFPEVVLFVVAE